MFKKILTAAAVAAVMCGSASAVAADFKIGLVSPARILAESAPAVAAQESSRPTSRSAKTNSTATFATSALVLRSLKRTLP